MRISSVRHDIATPDVCKWVAACTTRIVIQEKKTSSHVEAKFDQKQLQYSSGKETPVAPPGRFFFSQCTIIFEVIPL